MEGREFQMFWTKNLEGERETKGRGGESLSVEVLELQ